MLNGSRIGAIGTALQAVQRSEKLLKDLGKQDLLEPGIRARAGNIRVGNHCLIHETYAHRSYG